MRISDWSSDVCSSDLARERAPRSAAGRAKDWCERACLLPLDEIERVILPAVIFVFGQVEGRGELDRAFGALLMALRLALVAGIFARGRPAGEAGEPAGAAEAALSHGLHRVAADPAYPDPLPAR